MDLKDRRICFLMLILFCTVWYCSCERSFKIDYEGNQFLKDGKPFRYISGGMHYFRVPPSSWDDRMKKIRAAGMNTLQTYVAWNMHEPVQEKFNFGGENDLEHFISLAQRNDLLVIVRAGPYICAEWDLGGLPSWLLKNKSVILRSAKDPNYLKAVDRWLAVLLPKLRPLLYGNGGPIISVQVENEYGSYYACDHIYMNHLHDVFRQHLGEDVVLFTTDGPGDGMLECGGIPSIYRTVDFGPGVDPVQAFKVQRKYQPHGPLVNSEFYTGWLDHWGQRHSRTDGKVVAQWLDALLSQNASVNLYMFEGGTNFGFMNGANGGGKYQPQPTSYDYDAPLSESGTPRDKYIEIREVVGKYTTLPPGPVPKPTPKTAYGQVRLTQGLSLLDSIHHIYPKGPPFTATYPLSMEQVDQTYGFILYRTYLPAAKGKVMLNIDQVRDRAVVLVDKVRQGVIDRNGNSSIKIQVGQQIDILVENQGRISYGRMNDPKGILGRVTYDGHVLQKWEMYPLDEEKLKLAGRLSVKYNVGKRSNLPVVPAFAFGYFQISDVTDTFLQVNNWNKGQAFINQFNVGRYWPKVGPQKTLYVPASFLRKSPLRNTIILFEVDESPCSNEADCVIKLVAKPDIG